MTHPTPPPRSPTSSAGYSLAQRSVIERMEDQLMDTETIMRVVGFVLLMAAVLAMRGE
jgi:hypothetical protein